MDTSCPDEKLNLRKSITKTIKTWNYIADKINDNYRRA